jgi:hypothetical protein
MSHKFSKSQIALAVATALGATAMGIAPGTTSANGGGDRHGKAEGTYVAGDFHNHTTCSDGSISMQKLVKKATDKEDTPWGLDWFVQAGHGGNGNRNCTLVEDATLATPAYPLAFSSGLTPPGKIPTRRFSPRVRFPAPRPTRTCGAGSRYKSFSTRCWSTCRPS